MSRLRRYSYQGYICFITSVTYRRNPILIQHADLLLAALDITKTRVNFKQIAWVIMPDHFHFLVDPVDSNLSDIIRRVKQSFSMNYRKRTGHTGRVWQLRFWDHVIRNQEDMKRHFDYIHYNPVKNGLVNNPFGHLHSSLHQFADEGYYAEDWGVREEKDFDGDFGE